MENYLQNYACGEWFRSSADGVVLRSAVNGDRLARSSSVGLDFAAMLEFGRNVGGPALRSLTFHQRALMLKALAKALGEHKDEFYSLSTQTGATKADSWIDIDGGLATLFVYSSKGRRELPNDTVFIDGNPEMISRAGTFTGQHICVPREGVAVHINAFNFPVWGMLEKLAPTLLAGMPAIVKPATSTSYLAERVFRRMIETGILPPGAVQLVCGATGDLFEHLGCQDVVAFTGSASTATRLRTHPRVIAESVRFTAETDSLNCSILGPDAAPGTPEFDLFIAEIVREMTSKAGQKCTAIRRAIVPDSVAADVVTELRSALARVRTGNPASKDVDMGALASLDQRDEVRERVRELAAQGDMVFGALEGYEVVDADAERGAFFAPVLLHCRHPGPGHPVHRVEAFGPVSSVITYGDLDEAIALARYGQGSLAGSIFTHDTVTARAVALGTAAWHGRLVLINRDCAKESTGHGSPLPHLVHGGPGRAGGGEELGGIRGVMHYMQRTALQGSPDTLAAITGKWMPKGSRKESPRHPFRMNFDELELGDTLISGEREMTLEDIGHFAEFTGDRFYAHMDDEAAAANPFFDGRVAHGYFILSAAAGLFVDPDPGPVLANYGLDNLRFMQPVYPGDRIKVALTCKQKTAREGEAYGEVRWDAEVTNQDGAVVANYDLLTLVARAGN
jgi:oxepin-CoA hydrolase/3-oxo-5,6-dehydrosuberyl-CoA semialdehyde dehydrogenase